MAILTTLAQLEEVQAAITAVMTGQSYSIGGRALTRANLEALTKRESLLIDRYYKETKGSHVNRVQFKRPI